MVSALPNSLDVSTEEVAAVLSNFAGLDVQQLAAEGYFQAIAYWLNERLVPQNVYAQVKSDEVAGCIKVLVEFERSPQPRRLLKFVCDRICKLNSNIIEGVYLIARSVGSAQTEWEQRIRIPTASEREEKATLAQTANPAEDVPEQELQPVQNEPATSKQLVHESPRSKVAREVVRSQFKFFRAALISGSATVAFLFGGLSALILSERLGSSMATESAPVTVPWYDETPESVAEEVAFRETYRTGRTVEGALETVAVIPHNDLAQPNDPTITMLFGGELGLNDFIFEEAESLDRLFSDLSIYQQADVAMVGLSEPLATASTTLQENFYHRTRPQAVRALKQGGIDIVNLASEGLLANGSRGLDETLVTLDRQGLYRVGAGRNQQEAHRPEILEVKGQRIAYLGYNPEAVKAAKADKAGVAHANSKERSHIVEDIRAIRPQVDWVVVNYRWGDVLGVDASDSADKQNEFAAIPEEWQQSLAHDAVDAGADLVVGYHPSQIQGAEIYRDRAIAYSLGDFVFGEAPLEDHDTAALRVSLRNRQMKVEFLPVSVRDSQIQMATGEQGTTILQGIRNASKSFDQPLRFPVVLKAPHNHTPKPDPALPTPALLPPLPTPAPIEPISTEMPPEEAYSPENIPTADIERYEAPAPNPMLGESDALFPAEPIPADSFQMETFPTETFTRPPDSLDSDSLDSDSLDFVEPLELHGAIPAMTVSSAAADITLPETISLAGLKDS
ncbi:MAG: CapA family protein, partial [Cyanobacteria bacterium P01_D01_bin.36]